MGYLRSRQPYQISTVVSDLFAVAVQAELRLFSVEKISYLISLSLQEVESFHGGELK